MLEVFVERLPIIKLNPFPFPLCFLLYLFPSLIDFLLFTLPLYFSLGPPFHRRFGQKGLRSKDPSEPLT